MKKILTLVLCFSFLLIISHISTGCSDDTFDEGSPSADSDSDSDSDSDTDVDSDSDTSYNDNWDCLICG